MTWRRRAVLATPSTVTVLAALLLVACTPQAAPPAVEQRRDVGLGAVTLHVRETGPPQAPPVVLLHGVPETSGTWRAVAADLAVDHRVVVPDLRGAGRSSFAPAGSDDYTKRAMAGDLAALLDALGVGPATVVGHDMGAMTALAWARARPDQVASLVLTGGGVPGFGLVESGPPHLRAFATAPPGRLAGDLAGREREFLDRFVTAGAVAPGSPAVRGLVDEAVAAYGRPDRLDAAFGLYRALGRDAADNRADPRLLAMPVLVVAGGAPGDGDLTATTVAALAPARRVVTIPGGGHFLPTERPAETAAAIRTAVP